MLLCDFAQIWKEELGPRTGCTLCKLTNLADIVNVVNCKAHRNIRRNSVLQEIAAAKKQRANCVCTLVHMETEASQERPIGIGGKPKTVSWTYRNAWKENQRKKKHPRCRTLCQCARKLRSVKIVKRESLGEGKLQFW